MKKIFQVLFFLQLGAMSAFGQSVVEINMTINNPEVTGKLYLEKVSDRGFSTKIDSVDIAVSPFLFNARIPEPGIYQLNIAGGQLVGLILDGDEKLAITADGAATDEKAPAVMVQGSEKMQIFNELQQKQFAFTNAVKEIDARFKAATKESERTNIRSEYLYDLGKHNEEILGSVKSLGTSAAGVLATNNFLDKSVSGEYFITLADQLQAEGKNYSLAKIFIQEVNKDRMGMAGVEAPDFELSNFKGEKIKLSSLRGKTVILDFWATWCGPCIMSFPGMKLAMDKYAKRDDVVFLFVDTFERVAKDQISEHVGKFMKVRGFEYLNPLMDTEGSVAYLYGVSSIPTKFLIGKDGKFLQKSRGFAGSDAAVLEEISNWLD